VAGQRLVTYGHSEREASEAWVKMWFDRQSEPSPPSPKSQPESDAPETVGDLLDRWLSEYVALHLAGRTLETYEGITRLYLLPYFGEIALADLRAAHIQRYINEMIAADLPTTTIARHKTTIQSALRWAVRPMGWLERVPMASVTAPTPRPGVSALNARQRSPDVVIPNADEVRHFLDVNRDDPLWALWYAGFTLGLRPSELIALGEDNLVIGPSGKLTFVTIHRKAYLSRIRPRPQHRDWVVEEPKRASYRTLEAPRSTLDVLRDQAVRMRRWRKQQRKQGGYQWPKQWVGWLFLRSNGGYPYDPSGLPWYMTRACELAGVGDWHPSTMRHFCASQLLESGVPVIRVAAWLGHRNGVMVERTYGHTLMGVRGQEPTGAILDRILGPVASEVASNPG
jgi:integrase